MNYLKLLSLVFMFFPSHIKASCNQQQQTRQRLFVDILSSRTNGEIRELKKYSQYGAEKISGKLGFESLFRPGLESEVSFTYLKSKGSSPRPVVIILSPLGGSNPLDSWIAHNLARYGISSITSYYQADGAGTSLDKTFQDTGENLQAQMTITDWLVQQPEVDIERIGIIGISFGGIRGSFLMGIDSRLKKAALVVTGGGLADIMATSQLADVVKLREKHLEEEAIDNLESYKDVFRKSQKVTMWDFLCERKSEDFLLFLDTKDTSVPTSTQKMLQEKLGGPQTYWSSRGHIGAAMSFGLSKVKKVAQFMLIDSL